MPKWAANSAPKGLKIGLKSSPRAVTEWVLSSDTKKYFFDAFEGVLGSHFGIQNREKTSFKTKRKSDPLKMPNWGSSGADWVAKMEQKLSLKSILISSISWNPENLDF